MTCSHFNNVRVKKISFWRKHCLECRGSNVEIGKHKLVTWQWSDIWNFLSSKERHLCLLLFSGLIQGGGEIFATNQLQHWLKMDWICLARFSFQDSFPQSRKTCLFFLESHHLLMHRHLEISVDWELLQRLSISGLSAKESNISHAVKTKATGETETVRWSPLTRCSSSHDQLFYLSLLSWRQLNDSYSCISVCFVLFWQSNVVNDFRFAFPSPSWWWLWR